MSGLVELARFERPYQADLARLFIESYGLTAVAFDTENQGYSDGAIVGVRLMGWRKSWRKRAPRSPNTKARGGARSASDRRRRR